MGWGPMVKIAELPMEDDRTGPYALLRDEGPVVAFESGYLVTTRELGEYVFKNPDLFSSRLAFEGLGSPVPLIPNAFDPPEHTDYRRMLQPYFAPRAAQATEEQARAQARALIAVFAGKGRADAVVDFCKVYAAQTFLGLLGLPAEDWPRMLEWKEAILRGVDVSGSGESAPEAAQAAGELMMYLAGYVQKCRADGGAGMLPELLARGELSDEEALGLCYMFTLAGIGSLADALSLIFAKLAERPDLQKLVVGEPEIIPSLIEECVRLDPPNLQVPRIATRDVELAGTLIPAGSVVGVALGPACRDTAELTDPDVLDPRRAENHHLAFGSGPHRCIGIHVARVQMRVALEEWHRLIPSYELAPGTRPRVPWPIGNIGVPSVEVVF
jgi:cytochrome P450